MWLLCQGCYFARFLPGKFDKQGFAMFLFVFSARSHLQASTSSISFPPLIQSIHLRLKNSTDLNRDCREMIGWRDALAAAGIPGKMCRSEAAVSSLEGDSVSLVARRPERGLPRPGRGLCLPAATWHRTRAQGSVMQAWPRNPEQGRDSYILQQAPFSGQT